MNTFMPLYSFTESAKCLDRLRLGVQRKEALQILEACLRGSGGWVNHPATKMWKGFEIALCHYGQCCCYEWKQRGYVDNLYAKFAEKLELLPIRRQYHPPWRDNKEVYSAYRAALLYKDPIWYGRFGWSEKPAVPNEKGSLPYVWPT